MPADQVGLLSALDAIPHWRAWLGALWALYLLALSIWIVLQKRSPLSTLSWILSLAALPVIGFVVYFLLGPQKINRQRIRRQRMKQLHAPAQESAEGSDEGLPPCNDSLSRLLRSTTGVRLSSARSLQFLSDGAATYAALTAAIEQAQRHIHLAYYIFDPDRVGLPMLDALTAAARRGVHVRLLVDAVGSSRLKNRHLAALRAAGGEVAWFHAFRIAKLRGVLNLRLHRKIVVIDGEIGFTGGINICETQHEGIHANAFHDLHLRIEGVAVAQLQTVFAEDWAYAAKRPLGEATLYPPQPHGPIAMQIVGSGPDSLWEAIHRLHLQAIWDARERIWLATPYFVPGEAALYALTGAALRGVDVRVLVPRRSDSWVVTFAARSYFDELMAAGVRVYEYQPTVLHSKTLLIDDDCVLIGSANFDSRSFRLNFEVCAAIYDSAAAGLLEHQFERDFSQSRRVQRPRRLDPLRRLGEASARLLSPLL
ncbi:MAG: cardiolipin synthase [Lysobacteraceae bacterium]